MKEKFVTYSATISTSKYNNSTLDDIADFVYGAKDEKEAIENAKRILKRYERRLTAWQLIKLLFNK